MEDMVKAASELNEGDDKDKLVKHIANLLKTSYLQWNRDSVNDNLIIKQLEELSNGKLTISSEKLRDTSDIIRTFKKKKLTIKIIQKINQEESIMGAFEIIGGKNLKEKSLPKEQKTKHTSNKCCSIN